MSRSSDRLEWAVALTTVVLSLLAVPVSAAIGTATQTRLELAAFEQQTNGVRVTAVLLEDAPERAIGPTGLVEAQPHVKATWTLPDGSSRTAPIATSPGAKAGDRVVVWLDAAGAPTAPPMRPGDIALSAVLTAVLVLMLTEVCLFLVYALVRALLDRARLAQWEAEWTQVEPTWRRELSP